MHPETPEEGRSLADLFAGQPVDIGQIIANLKTVAKELDLPFGDRTMTYNSRLAQELGHWAETKAKGDEFHHAVFKAYFVDGKNIAKMPELLDIAESVGLPGNEAKTVIENRSFRKSVDSDWEKSRNAGIKAVPTFIYNGRRLVGAQKYEALKKLVE